MPEQHPSANSNVAPLAALKSSLALQRTNGDSVVLTPAHLEKWFAKAQASLLRGKHQLTSAEIDASTPSLAAEFLGHIGLQTPQQVGAFWKSRTGTVVLAMIGEQLAEAVALEDNVRQELLDQQRRETRFLSFALFGLMLKHEAHAHQLNEEALHIIEKNAKAATSKGQTSTTLVLPKPEKLKEDLAAYTEASKALESLLDKKQTESKEVDTALAEVTLQIAFAAIKYGHYQTYLDSAYGEIANFSLLPTIPTDSIHTRIGNISAEIDADTNEISELLNASREEMVREKMEIITARRLQIAAFQDLLSVITGEKLLYTLYGIPTQNYNEAHFILSQELAREKKIVFNEETGTYYLLAPSKNIKDLSNEDRQEGEQAYLRLRPQIMGAKQRVEHDKKIEEMAHNERKTSLLTRHASLKEEASLIRKQLTQVQANRANIEASLKSMTPELRMTPVPTPTANSRVSTPPSSYTNMLPTLKPGSSVVTEQVINWFQQSMNMSMRNTPYSKKQQDLINRLVLGQPIPPELMRILQARAGLGQVGINPGLLNAAKTNVSPSLNKPASPVKEMPTPTPTAAPTPFSTSMKPKPYK